MFGWFEKKFIDEPVNNWYKEEVVPDVDEDFVYMDQDFLDFHYNQTVELFGQEKAEELMPNTTAWYRITK